MGEFWGLSFWKEDVVRPHVCLNGWETASDRIAALRRAGSREKHGCLSGTEISTFQVKDGKWH